MSTKLDKNILATIIYYDGLNYPLSAFEIWKHLLRTDYYLQNNEPVSISLSEVLVHLQDNELSRFVEHLNGFYFLKGRSDLVANRIANNKISKSKIARLEKITWWLRFVPFVRMVGITGALAMKNAKAQSDLDLLVVLKYRRIWTGRTLVTGFLHFWGKRRHGKKIADRACLNFFVTDKSLEVVTKDLFSANEYSFLFPLFGFEAYQKFQIKNKWIRNMKPAYALCEIAPFKTIEDSYLSKKIRSGLEKFFDFEFVENILRKKEKKRIMLNPKTHQEGSLIYANDDALVFLPSPHGPRIFEKFKEKIEQLSL